MTPRAGRALTLRQSNPVRPGDMNPQVPSSALAALTHRLQPGLSILSALCVMAAGFIAATVLSGTL